MAATIAAGAAHVLTAAAVKQWEGKAGSSSFNMGHISISSSHEGSLQQQHYQQQIGRQHSCAGRWGTSAALAATAVMGAGTVAAVGGGSADALEA